MESSDAHSCSGCNSWSILFMSLINQLTTFSIYWVSKCWREYAGVCQGAKFGLTGQSKIFLVAICRKMNSRNLMMMQMVQKPLFSKMLRANLSMSLTTASYSLCLFTAKYTPASAFIDWKAVVFHKLIIFVIADPSNRHPFMLRLKNFEGHLTLVDIFT